MIRQVEWAFRSEVNNRRIQNTPIRDYLEPILRPVKGRILDVGTGLFGVTYLPDFLLDHRLQSNRLVLLDERPDLLILDRLKNLNADGERLPIKKRAFGAVISTRLYGYLSNPINLIKEMIRVLKKNGTFILIDWEGDLTSFDKEIPPRLTNFYPGEVEKLLKVLGLSKITIQQLFHEEMTYQDQQVNFDLTAIVGKKL